jgi:hypothetical protein
MSLRTSQLRRRKARGQFINGLLKLVFGQHVRAGSTHDLLQRRCAGQDPIAALLFPVVVQGTIRVSVTQTATLRGFAMSKTTSSILLIVRLAGCSGILRRERKPRLRHQRPRLHRRRRPLRFTRRSPQECRPHVFARRRCLRNSTPRAYSVPQSRDGMPHGVPTIRSG